MHVDASKNAPTNKAKMEIFCFAMQTLFLIMAMKIKKQEVVQTEVSSSVQKKRSRRVVVNLILIRLN
jgi:hypothetical protein